MVKSLIYIQTYFGDVKQAFHVIVDDIVLHHAVAAVHSVLQLHVSHKCPRDVFGYSESEMLLIKEGVPFFGLSNKQLKRCLKWKKNELVNTPTLIWKHRCSYINRTHFAQMAMLAQVLLSKVVLHKTRWGYPNQLQ